MNKLLFLSSVFLLSSFSPGPRLGFKYHPAGNTVHGKVVVYSTADNTSYRLTATDTLSFSDFGQPLETQPCVFVDPSRSFQTFVGIGGALTDASAETYAKLPPNKQAEFMQSYFSLDKGIGYSLARTN
ncbi:MAG TPA: hypothetical protein VK543_19250, partial [Puia sp.]|nr:hypothetical protein [Puia sp.]